MIIIGISGKKKGGKSTLAEDVMRYASDLWPRYRQGRRVATEVVYQPFAEPIKRMAVDLLGISQELVYGNDDDKNTLTEIRWGDMPHYLSLPEPRPEASEWMRVRDILQQLGTEIFRKMFSNCFCRYWYKQIQSLASSGFDGVVVTDDVRFSNELHYLNGAGAYVVRLLRGEVADGHASETSLSDTDTRFDLVLNNCNMSKYMTFGSLIQSLTKETGQVKVSTLDAQIALLRAEELYRAA